MTLWQFGLVCAFCGFVVYEYIEIETLNDHLRHLPARLGNQRPMTKLELVGTALSILAMAVGVVLFVIGVILQVTS